MNNPANVPPLMDARFTGWDTFKCSFKQTFALRELLRQEGIDPRELYGDGFSCLEDLSRWAASWGIGLLESRQQARWTEHERQRVEQRREMELKRFIAEYYRDPEFYERQGHVKRS